MPDHKMHSVNGSDRTPVLPGTNPPAADTGTAVIELRVRNHSGAMSHITGLFARRGFNLEGIVCAPNTQDAGATSRMLLLVDGGSRLNQIERQLTRLYDVLDVQHRTDIDRKAFAALVHAFPAARAHA